MIGHRKQTDNMHVQPYEAEDGVSRRRFLVTTGATGAAAAAVIAVGSGAASASTRPHGQASRPASKPAAPSQSGKPSAETDLATAAFAASLEVLAVGTYQAALDAAGAGKLGPVPPVVATFATTAKAQHQQHLDKLNSVLTGAGKAAVTQPDAKLKATVDGRFAQVTDAIGVAKLARDLEVIASATYQKAIPTLTPETAVVAGSILCVDRQHVAILNYALGEYPVPDTFASTEMAASPS